MRDATHRQLPAGLSATIVLALWIAAGSVPAGAAPADARDTRGAPPTVVVIPKPTDEVLLNPGMGLYLACGSRSAPVKGDEWFLNLANMAYYRMNWSDVEPEEGADLDRYFGPIFDFWVGKLRGRVAIRVMAESLHSRSRYVTPKWVFDKGVPSVLHTSPYAGEQVDPVFWDDKYLGQSDAFIQRLGRYLDGKPGLEFVDIGQIGEWGEMHLGQHIAGRWTGEQLEQTGYTLDKYIAAYRRTIDAFAAAFPRTQVFLNVGDYAAINDYAGLRHVHFRQDGLTPSGPSSNVGERFFTPWSTRGIKGNYEFHSGYRTMQQNGWDLHATIRKGLEAPISYLNTNILGVGELARAPDEVRRELTAAARRVGFRFVVTRVEYTRQFHVSENRPGRVLVKHSWTNAGVAPCYESYALRFALTDASGRSAAEYVHYPSLPTTEWWPGSSVTLNTVIRVPAGLKPGDYTLQLGMFFPARPDDTIRLGIAGGDARGRYEIGPIAAVKSEAGPEVLYEENFEGGPGKWRPARGMQLSVSRENAHGGAACVALTGSQEGAWNYGDVQLPFPIVPGGKYRLSGWMRVNQLDPARPPYFKLGVADSQGRHLANHSTELYDLNRRGTWQQLAAVFETSPEAARGTISLEKGSQQGMKRAEIQLDDVKLELLESF